MEKADFNTLSSQINIYLTDDQNRNALKLQSDSIKYIDRIHRYDEQYELLFNNNKSIVELVTIKDEKGKSSVKIRIASDPEVVRQILFTTKKHCIINNLQREKLAGQL